MPFRAAVISLLLFPGAANAGITTLVQRDVPLRGGRTLSQAAPRFELVGLHWQGPGTVRFRTHPVGGRWSAWHSARPEGEDLPDAFTAEARRTRGWRVGNPYWTGLSDGIQYRLKGTVRRLRAYFVASPAEKIPLRRVSIADSPPLISRLGWGANEGIRRAAPSYADFLRLAIVHHTAGSNSYSRAQSAAIVRAIEVYHVKGNGWNDIGYNFLVDKYGQIFEGRYGGVDRNVVGAHAQGFNTGTVGVAVLGNYNSAGISTAARDSLAELLSWRLDLAHVDPLSTLTFPSGGNPRFPPGTPVFLRAISGHRDTGFTDCPGNRLYAQLGAISEDVATLGLPKLYDPSVQGAIGGKVRFRARLSEELPWTGTVLDGLGKTVASVTGTGESVDWTWDATGSPLGRYSYTIQAPDVRSATGVIGGSAVPLTLALSAPTTTVTPNGDGRGDELTIGYRLGAGALVTASVVDESGAPLLTLFSSWRDAGRHSYVWPASTLPDGRYKLSFAARTADGRQTQSALAVLVDRTLAGFRVTPRAFSPNGDDLSDLLTLQFGLGAPATVKVRVLRRGKTLGTLFEGPLQPGPQRLVWDGELAGQRVADGTYHAVASATDTLTTLVQGTSFRLDTTAPRLKLLSAARLDFWVSERSIVRLLVNGKRIVKIEPAGKFHVPHAAPVQRVSAVATDAAGNTSAPVTGP